MFDVKRPLAKPKNSSYVFVPEALPTFYREVVGLGLGSEGGRERDTAVEQQQQPMIFGDSSSGGEDHEVKPPKKRAETWVQEETRSLISFRREVDGFFNTSKSNRHLWDQISVKMRDKGFDRSPTMCTDKWRNLLKEFKKVKHTGGGSDSAKTLYHKEIEELLRGRIAIKSNNGTSLFNKSPTSSKVDSYMHFPDSKGLEDDTIIYGTVEASGRSTVNLEMPLDNDGDPLLTAADAIAASGVPSWNWRDTPGNGAEGHSSYGGRVINVKWGEYTRRIGIDGTSHAIKEAIKSAFGLRTRRAFWLEGEDNVVRSLDRDMPLGNYILRLDEGISIKICVYDESARSVVRTEDKTFYSEDNFCDFLTHRCLMGLREINGFRCLNNLDDLRPGALYQVVRLLGD